MRNELGSVEVTTHAWEEVEVLPCEVPVARCAARFCAMVIFSRVGSAVSIMPKVERSWVWAEAKMGLKRRVEEGARTGGGGLVEWVSWV